MKTKTSIRVIVIFMVAMVMSVIPEWYPSLFGDWVCIGSGDRIITDSGYYDMGCNIGVRHLPETHWGYRHWLWFFMGLVLFIFQVIKIVKDETD
jgi:hypothetical protein